MLLHQIGPNSPEIAQINSNQKMTKTGNFSNHFVPLLSSFGLIWPIYGLHTNREGGRWGSTGPKNDQKSDDFVPNRAKLARKLANQFKIKKIKNRHLSEPFCAVVVEFWPFLADIRPPYSPERGEELGLYAQHCLKINDFADSGDFGRVWPDLVQKHRFWSFLSPGDPPPTPFPGCVEAIFGPDEVKNVQKRRKMVRKGPCFCYFLVLN